MDSMTVGEIVKAVGGELLCGDPQTEILNVSINSKEITTNTLFIPLVGSKTDAHKFLGDVICNNNTKAVFTQRKELCNNEKCWIYVEDCHSALQSLAKYYRSKIGIPIIGVTGSVGKTTTKEMLYAVLSTQKKVYKTAGNQNSQIGLPLNILKIDKTYELAVLEMGMSMFGEMEKLSDIAKPDYAIITNIGLSHIGNLKTQENIFKEKFHIADFIKDKRNIIVNGDDKILSSYKFQKSPQVLSFGLQNNNNIYAGDISCDKGATNFTINVDGEKHEATVNTIGKHHILNALAATVVALKFGISIENIKKGIANFSSPKMRQDIHYLDNLTVIDDSYNSSPDSVRSALYVLDAMNNTGMRIAVLADILELGEQSKKIHYDLGFDIINSKVDILITIGTQAEQIAKCVRKNTDKIKCFSFDDNNSVKELLVNELLQSKATVLIKGSRGMKTEEIVEYIISKSSRR